MTSGGRKRSTLPYVPQVRTSRPSAWQALASAAVASGFGSLVPGP